MKLNQRSVERLHGVHPDLHRVVYRAAEISEHPFIVTEGVRIEWGGDWHTFKDGPHFQLPIVQYPATK